MYIKDIEKNFHKVKKITTRYKEIVQGLILPGYITDGVKVVTANGSIKTYEFDDILSITNASSLSPEIKKQYELIAKKDKEKKILSNKLEAAREDFDKSCEELIKISKLYSFREFSEKLYNRLTDLGIKNISLSYNIIRINKFIVRFSYNRSEDFNFLMFDYNEQIDKYLDIDEYDFIEEEYDRTYHISSKTKQYKEILEKNIPKIVFKNINGFKLEVEKSLDVGDKDTLWAEYKASYIPKTVLEFNEENVEKIAGIIKEIFG